jgi:hypothetical protein
VNKKSALWILLDLVFLVVFNVVFFVMGGSQHPASVWISYAFIHFAYIMLVITPFLIRKGSVAAVFGVSLNSISSVYFFVVFVVGVIIIVAHPANYKGSLIVHVIIAGLYAIMLISNMIANENTADSIERHEMELQYVKESSAMLKSIMEMASDKALKKKIEKAYDLLHSSQVKSSGSVRDYEVTVMNLIKTLEQNVAQDDVAAASVILNEIMKNANERNRRLRL